MPKIRPKPTLPSGLRGLAGFSVSLLLAALTGCSEDALFGVGPGPDVEVTTPGGVQSGPVTILYTLSHESIASSDVQASYSTNGGASFRAASEGAESDGTDNLSVSPAGEVHVFVWDSAADVADGRHEDVLFRISPQGEERATTEEFSLHNSVFLAASHDATDEISLLELGLTTGDVRPRVKVDSGGENPGGTLYHEGTFYCAHTASNDIGAFQLDVEVKTLVPVEGTPFASGGIGSKYLAASGDFIFVSNVSSETICVLKVDTTSGSLTLVNPSGVRVFGCRSMVVRGGRLYVASETQAVISVLDIGAGGELLVNSFSPIAAAGMLTPRALAILGGRLYAADFGSASLHGFSFLGGGDLLPLAGSPYPFTQPAVEQIAVHASGRLFLAGGTSQSFTSLSVDVGGVVSEDLGSPVLLAAPVRSVTAAQNVVVLGTSASMAIEVYRIEDDGTILMAPGSPYDVGGHVAGLATSN